MPPAPWLCPHPPNHSHPHREFSWKTPNQPPDHTPDYYVCRSKTLLSTRTQISRSAHRVLATFAGGRRGKNASYHATEKQKKTNDQFVYISLPSNTVHLTLTPMYVEHCCLVLTVDNLVPLLSLVQSRLSPLETTVHRNHFLSPRVIFTSLMQRTPSTGYIHQVKRVNTFLSSDFTGTRHSTIWAWTAW